MPQRERLERLVDAVQALSLARDVDSVAEVVRRAARALTGADGATFVLRDNEQCYYVDEDAISPLWKGQRFPLSACISGWSMLNRSATVIEDIYADSRIPHAAYRPTFVKSLVMVPIRKQAPIGAIGNYWANQHCASEEEVSLLQALADSTSVAMESVQLYAELEERVRERTRALDEANHKLQAEVVQRRQAQAQVEQLSRTDALTGLLNRRGFFAAAGPLFEQIHAHGTRGCLLYADLDGLKACNDGEGHAAGDALIREAAEVLSGVVQAPNLLARLGGDEFAAVLMGESASVEVVRACVVRRLEAHNAERPPGRALRLSLGVVEANGSGSLDQWLAEGDRAMYLDKRRGQMARGG